MKKYQILFNNEFSICKEPKKYKNNYIELRSYQKDPFQDSYDKGRIDIYTSDENDWLRFYYYLLENLQIIEKEKDGDYIIARYSFDKFEFKYALEDEIENNIPTSLLDC